MNCSIWKSTDRRGSRLGNPFVTLFRTAILLALLAGAGRVEAQAYATWTYNKVILFNTTSSGANVAGNVTNFPVLVKLNSGNFNFGQALANGEDIRFEDPDGTALSYQIEAWDGGAQVADIWVRVPQVNGNSATDYIRLYWGKAGATTESSGNAVFQTTNGFAGAWHLAEDGNTAVGGYSDATVNGNGGTGTAMTAVSDVSAISAKGQNFVAASNQVINVGSGSTLNGGTALTIDAWFNTTTQNANAIILSKAYTTNTTPFDEYKLDFNSAGNIVRFGVTTGGTSTSTPGTTTLANGTWYHVAGTYDGSNIRLYLNGVEEAFAAKSGTLNNYAQALTVGKYHWDNTKNFDGVIDEPRVATAVRSPDWIKLTFSNQKPSQNLVLIAPRVWDGGGADDLWSNPLNWNGDVIPTSAEDVVFDATSVDNVTLGGNVSVRSLTMTAGYTGAFNFSSFTLTVNTGAADFRSGGAITAGSGGLSFTSSTAQNFHPKSGAAFPSVTQNGSGGTTILTNAATMATLTISSGTLALGSGMTHFATGLSIAGGGLDFGSSTLSLSAATIDFSSLGSMIPGTGTLAFNSASAQTFTPKAALTFPSISKSNAGTVTVATNALTAGAFSISTGTWDWGSTTLTHILSSITSTGGTMTFGTNTVRLSGNADLAGLGALNANTGILEFTTTSLFIPKAGATHPAIWKSVGGATTVGTNHLITNSVTVTGGTLDLSSNTLDLTCNGNLTLSGATGTLTLTNSNTSVAGDVSISNGILNCPGSSKTFSVAGSYTYSSGTMNVNAGTLTLNGTATGKNLDLTGGGLNNLTLNGSGGVWTAITNVDVAGTFTLTAGTLDLSNIKRLNAGTYTQSGGILTSGTGDVDANGNFTQTGGTFTAPDGARIFYVGGGFTQTGGTFTPGSGKVTFDGVATGNTINCLTTLNAVDFTGAGEWTVITNPLSTGNLTLAGSTLILGSGLIHEATGTPTFLGGVLDFGSSTLRVHSSTVNLNGLTTLTSGTGTLEFMNSGAKSFTPKSAAIHPKIKMTGAGTVTLATYGLTAGDLDLNAGTLDIVTYTLTVGGNLTLAGGSLTATNGTVDVNGNVSATAGTLTCPSGTFSVTGNFTAAAGVTLTNNSGTVLLDGAATGRTLDINGILNNLTVNGAGGVWTVTNTGLSLATLNITAGTLNLGSALTSTAGSIVTSGGTLDFGSSTLVVSLGNASLSGLGTLTPGTGTLSFQAASGIQIFTPKSASSHPAITHTGAGELELATFDLSCLSFSQSAGTLDFGGRNITTTAGGNFTLTNGTAASLVGLAARTITVAGNASLSGATSASRLNLNPAAAWYLYATGTATVQLASVANAVSTAYSTVACTNCSNEGGNTNWTFSVTWDGGGADANWSTANNWASDFVPTALDAVTFNATSLNATLDVAASVRFITFTSGYTGTFSFSSNTLTINSGNADLRSGGNLTAGTGTLEFTGTAAQTFIPKNAAMHPTIKQNGSGGTTVSTNHLSANGLSIAAGTFYVADRSVSITTVNFTGGGLDFGTGWLSVSGATVDFSALAAVTAGAGELEFTGASAQTFTPKIGATFPTVKQNGTGGTTISTNGLTMNSLTLAGGTLNLGTGLTHSAAGMTVFGGGLDFGSSTLQFSGSSANFTSLASMTAGTGTLAFTRTSAQTFIPKASLTFPAIHQNGSGGTTLSTNALTAGALTITTGTFNLGSSLSHTVASIGSAGGELHFNSSTLSVNAGNVSLNGLATLTPSTGTLAFTAASGVQILTPKSASSHPAITHTGAGELELATYDLSCLSLSQTAGTLDFGVSNITTTASGNFTLTNGTASTLVGLAGRTITVAGNASLSGAASTSRLNLNPAAAWYLNATGTATVQLASVANAVSTSYSTVACTNCGNEGSNTNWTFSVTWDGGGGNAFWTTAANWGSDAVPTSADDITFNAGSQGAVLDAAATVKSLTMASGYTGSLDFGGSTLSISGNADFRSGGGIIANSGTLAFTGTGSQTFIPKSGATFPAITQNGNAGTTTVTTNALAAGNLTLTLGTFHLGAALTHTVGAISGTGSLDFGTSNLNATGNVDLSGLAVTASSSNTLAFTGASAQTHTHKTGLTALNLTQNGSGGTTLASQISMPTLTIAAGTLNLGTSAIHHVTTAFNVTGGGLIIGTSTDLRTPVATVDLSALTSLASTGFLVFNGSSAQTFTPKASTTHPVIVQGGTGGTTITGNALIASSISVSAGTFNLGSGFTHSTLELGSSGGGLTFNNSTLQVTSGNADFSGLATLTPGTGTVAFTAASGIQILTPKSAANHPAITHTGAGTLQLATNVLSCASFSQSAGSLNLNSLNITTIASGSFTVTNGTTSSFSGLSGRTITVAGNASFTGTSGSNRLNLNPGAAWNLAVTGTLSASLASVDFSNASASTSAGSCSNCANQGSNTNWAFAVTWDGGGADNNWTTAGNWGSDAVPTSAEDVAFNSTSVKNATLDAAASVKSIAFTTGYSGTFSFSSNTLTVIGGNADFRSSGAIAAGTGILAFTSTSAQTFFPRAGATFPAITQNGTGGTTISSNALAAGNITVTAGTLNLGASMSHSVGAISGSGGLDFGTSNLDASGNVDFSGATVTATSASTLAFTGASAQTFTPKASVTALNLTQSGAGGTTVSTNGFTTPLLTIGTGTLTLGSSLNHAATAIAFTGGGLNFNSGTLRVPAATVDLRSLATLTGNGTLELNGTSAQTLHPKASTQHPNVHQNGSGGTAIASNSLQAGTLTIDAGTFDLGTGFSHNVASVNGSAGGLTFNNSTLEIVNSTANFSGLASLTPGTGTIRFAAPSGTQVFTPKASTTYPAIVHSGASTLQLAVNPLLCASFNQSSGTLDFNSQDITTVSAGNFTITGGNSTSLSNLGGRTLTVAGNSVFDGTSASTRLGLNPTSTWTLAAGGTVSANFADIAFSNSSVTGLATNSVDGGNNTAWTFAITWSGLGTDNNWTTSANWTSGAVPGSTTNVVFNGTGTKAAVLDASGTVKSIQFNSAYTGDFNFSSNILTVAVGNADFRSGGTVTAGTGTLTFTSSGAQSYFPKAGSASPHIVQNGSGTTTVGANPLSGGNLTVTSGTFHLGSALSNSVRTVGGAGSLDFGSSAMFATGNVDLSGMTVTATSANTLIFTGTSAQTFTPKASVTALNLTLSGSGGVTVSGSGFTTPTLNMSAGSLNLGAGLTHTVTTSLGITGGTLDFSSATLKVAAASVDLTALATLTPGTGILEFISATAQTFSPRSGATHPALIQSGTGGTTLATNPVTAGNLTLTNGTFTLGNNGFTHVFAGLSATGGGLAFSNATLQTSGNVNLGTLGTLTAGTGTLSFTAASGTQVFVPKSTAIHPLIAHHAAGTLQLSGSDLTTLGFNQSAGILDLNTRNLILSGTGSLDISGNPTPIIGLGGRSLTIGGYARFAGTPATKLDLLSPSSWTLAVSGTLTAVNVRLSNSLATLVAGIADSSLNQGGNSGWTFVDSIKPDNVSGFLASAVGGTSAALSWTPSVSADADSVMLRYRTDGAYPTSRTDGTLWRRVAAAKAADTATGLTDKTVYHFAAFVKDSSGNYSLATTAARDTARTPDITPPANVTAVTANGLASTTISLAWIPSGTADADSVMIRYRTGTAFPANSGDGTLWKKLSNAKDKDTVTGLAANTIYAFGLFVRDSSGNYAPAVAGAQDTALWQLPVTGTVAISDLAGKTNDGDPALAFAWSGADSLRFSLLPDTGTAAWKSLRSLDSLALGPVDGQAVIAAQFKNVFGKRSAWMRDTTLLDRKAPVVTFDLKAAHSRWNWPVSVSGKSKDSLVGTDRVFVIRQRLADGFHFNSTSWTSTPDTAKLVLGAADSLFSAPLPAAAMTTGDYRFTAYAKDLVGNVSVPIVVNVRFEENRKPALAFGSVPDTVLQNQSGNWSLDFGDLDAADSLITVTFDSPAWLAAAPGPDTAYAPWALHKVFKLSGKPLQADVGTNTVRVLMQDRGGLIFTHTRSIQVVDVNDAPVFADSQSAYSVKEDSVSRWSPRFKDEDAKDTHTMALLAAPAFASLENLSVVFNPASRDVGDHTVRVTVSDGKLLDTLETRVTVVNVNDPPYAFPSKGWQSPAFWKEDHRDTFTVVVVDMDKSDLVKLVTPMPAFARVTTTVDSTGFNRSFQFVLTPGQNDTGSVNIALSFQDAAGAVSKLALIGKVVQYNDTPFAAIEDVSTHAGAARVRLSVTDEDGSLEKARFHYRLIGPAGDTVRRGITPSSLLALHPLADGAYKIAVMAEDQDGARQPAYTVKPFSISGATRLFLDSARWHMLGAPHAALPASAFGAGATLATWDETGDDGQPLARYSSGQTVETLKRGKGYWVRLRANISVSAAQTDLMEGPFTLKLTHSKQGWNQIANPFPYFVDASASRLTFWEWDAEKRDLVNARGLLKPWAAYWVLAPRDTSLVLSDSPYFPPVAVPLAKTASDGSANFRNRGDWSVQLALRAGGYHDQANLLGVRPAPGTPDMPATPALGAGLPGFALPSLPDAPKFGDYVALHFEKPGEAAAQGFANDFHSRLDPEEEWWDFSVENAGTGENQAQLAPAGLEALAKNGLNIFLVRKGEASRIEPGGTVTLSMEEAKTYYSLVVTPHADFAARLKGNFSISQNFPNPVTTFTAFRFFLPQSWDMDGKRMAKDFKLRINLYDYSGRRVAQVASGSFRPGSHTLLWKPVSMGGGALSKGAYVYRLETSGFVKSLKLVVE